MVKKAHSKRGADKYLMSSESVTEGHPDKVCDQISDGVLDEIIKQDPTGRVACETFITMGLVIVGGEVTTSGYVDIPKLVRGVVKDIGYTNPKYGFDYETCAILNAINRQSPDIAQGVDRGGAGDQGMMIGYACNETEELMPLPISLAHRLTLSLAEVRKKRALKYLGPDGKSQVTVEYHGGNPKRVSSVVIATQHTDDILDKTGLRITRTARQEIINTVIKPVLKDCIDKRTKFYVNETGKFVVGGPQSDTGMTGRKIIVDTYGGTVAHGGGAFCVEGDSFVNTEDGLLRIKDMRKTVLEGKLVKTDIHPERPKEWYDNGQMQTIRIVTSDGYELEGSKNQCIRVIDKNGNYVWRRFDKIEKGDFVAVHRKNRLFGNQVSVDFDYQYKKGTRRKNDFSFPEELTEDYAYLMGLLIGDGNCMMDGGIAICVCEPQQKKNVQNLYKRLFDRKGKIFGHWAFMGGVEMRAYLKTLGLDYKRAWEKDVPESIFKAPKSAVSAFLRGLFDCDGCIRMHGRNGDFPDINLFSTSLNLIKSVQQLLLNYGIISQIGLINNVGKEFEIRGKKRTTRRIEYKLRIKGGKSVEIFASEIGFALKRKQKRLTSMKQKKENLFFIPNQKNRISRLYKKLDLADRQKDIAKIGRFTRCSDGKATKELTYHKLSEFLSAYKDKLFEDKDYQHCRFLNDMEHYYAKVEKIEYSCAHVYDLLVPMSHTFTANGFVCHNSGKDPTKVDRSAAYMARYVAKNIVASGAAEKCLVQLAYCIGVAEPVSLLIDTYETGKLPEVEIVKLVRSNFDLTPVGIIRDLKLRRPIFRPTAAYGHFGRETEGFTWEETNKAEVFK